MHTAKLYTVTAFDTNGTHVQITKDTLLKAKHSAQLLRGSGHAQVTIWDGQVGGARVR
jgi:hypothetical protein